MKRHPAHEAPPSDSSSRGRARTQAVVVGVDTPSTFDALEWAAAEAAARGSPLRIVHALQLALWPTPVGAAHALWAAQQESGAILLQQAAARAREVDPGLDLSTHLVQGSARQALYDQAQGAALLVLGSRARRGLREALGRSVSTHAVAHAPCPVVLVPPGETGTDRSNAAQTGARVVLGIDLTPSSAQAIPFAFRAAQQRGIPLTVVHAVAPDMPADIEACLGSPDDVVSPAGSGLRTVLDALAPWRAAFPAVTVNVRLMCGDPTRELIAASQHAALTVVGSRGYGRVRASLFPSVSREVLLHARGPVAIVRRDRSARAPAAIAAQGATA